MIQRVNKKPGALLARLPRGVGCLPATQARVLWGWFPQQQHLV